MSAVLEELVAAGERTNRSDPEFVELHYIEHPSRLHCVLAIDDDDRVLGFQSLKRAFPDNPYGTPVGWGIIGTHVRPSAARRGIGSQLFAATIAGARKAELPAIEAYIGEGNAAALAYYEAIGFSTCRHPDGAICKLFQISRSSAA
jgi:GNAT superfamily N-acetyltransferase